MQDTAGNALAADFSWSFTTGTPLDQGPGGPILVIADDADPFGRYYAEILRTEGFNAFAVSDISSVSAATLAAYDVVILDVTSLTSAQVTMVSNWVNAGGNLIAMRPDPQLAGLLGADRDVVNALQRLSPREYLYGTWGGDCEPDYPVSRSC